MQIKLRDTVEKMKVFLHGALERDDVGHTTNAPNDESIPTGIRPKSLLFLGSSMGQAQTDSTQQGGSLFSTLFLASVLLSASTSTRVMFPEVKVK
jgi:hypothetical protein